MNNLFTNPLHIISKIECYFLLEQEKHHSLSGTEHNKSHD